TTARVRNAGERDMKTLAQEAGKRGAGAGVDSGEDSDVAGTTETSRKTKGHNLETRSKWQSSIERSARRLPSPRSSCCLAKIPSRPRMIRKITMHTSRPATTRRKTTLKTTLKTTCQFA
ncbi:hypothetical protein GN958_ATG11953, partial [Phytophthora infestans]